MTPHLGLDSRRAHSRLLVARIRPEDLDSLGGLSGSTDPLAPINPDTMSAHLTRLRSHPARHDGGLVLDVFPERLKPAAGLTCEDMILGVAVMALQLIARHGPRVGFDRLRVGAAGATAFGAMPANAVVFDLPPSDRIGEMKADSFVLHDEISGQVILPGPRRLPERDVLPSSLHYPGYIRSAWARQSATVDQILGDPETLRPAEALVRDVALQTACMHGDLVHAQLAGAALAQALPGLMRDLRGSRTTNAKRMAVGVRDALPLLCHGWHLAPGKPWLRRGLVSSDALHAWRHRLDDRHRGLKRGRRPIVEFLDGLSAEMLEALATDSEITTAASMSAHGRLACAAHRKALQTIVATHLPEAYLTRQAQRVHAVSPA